MTNNNSNSDSENLPAKLDQTSPDEPVWHDDVDMSVIVVRRYDTDDIFVGHQYFVVISDEEQESFIVSSVARPPEPASI